METRVALISIIVENNDVIDDINRFLHEAGKYIIGRMGIPYREKGINIISIAIDAPQDVISSLSGKIGRLSGVSTTSAPFKDAIAFFVLTTGIGHASPIAFTVIILHPPQFT